MSDKQFSVYDKEAMTFERMATCVCTLPIDMYVFIYVYK